MPCNHQETTDKTGELQQLQKLLQHPAIWRASQPGAGHQQTANSLPTHYEKIDRLLRYGGWPTHALIECLHYNHEPGALSLFLPALQPRADVQDTRPAPVLLIAPPYLPYSIAWRQHIDHRQLWVSSTSSLEETIWATEQAFKSGSCLAVFAWFAQHKLKAHQLRRLQLAAHYHPGLAVLFRDQRYRQQPSPAALRILTALTNHNSRLSLSVEILKQPGNWGGQQTSIPWFGGLQHRPAAASEWPVYYPQHSNNNYHMQSKRDKKPLTTRTSRRYRLISE